MIYQETIIRKKFTEPLKFYSGVHSDRPAYVDEIIINIERHKDGFYLAAAVYDKNWYINYSCYLSLSELDVKVAPYHRMAKFQINKLKTDEKVLKGGVMKLTKKQNPFDVKVGQTWKAKDKRRQKKFVEYGKGKTATRSRINLLRFGKARR